MKNNVRKLLAIALAAFLLLGICTTAFAASITIEKSETVNASDRTFQAYKLLDAEKVGDGYVYTVPAGLEDFYATEFTLDKTAVDFSYQVGQKIRALGESSSVAMYEFGQKALVAAKAAGIAGTSGTANAEDGSYVISDLTPGYYIVEDTTAGLAEGIANAAVMIETVTDDKEITIKADAPTIDKNIDAETDTDDANDEDEDGKVKENNVSVGDTVPYIIETTVPSMVGYSHFKFVITDTLSAGLDYAGELVVKIGDTTLANDTDYTFAITPAADQPGPHTITITFKDFIKYAEQAGQPIVVTYNATVNDEAVIGSQGNPNTVYLEYSNNPSNVKDGDDFQPDEPKGKTPDIQVKSFVTGIEIQKVDGAEKPLTGAEFTIEGTRLNTYIETGYKYVENADGDYYLLTNGTYTTEAPTDDTEEYYASTTTKYAPEEVRNVVTKEEGDVYGTFAVDGNGNLVITGLAAGKYTITEIKSPDGYNILESPIELTITCEYSNGDLDATPGTCTWTASFTGGAGEGTLTVTGTDVAVLGPLTVVNKAGTELPSTGGIGTTIFYIVGAALIIGAGVLLITKKRMASQKQD